MSIQSILAEAGRFVGPLKAGDMSMDALQQQIRDTCFVKPKVPDSKFLETCRKYDPTFLTFLL